MSFVPLAVEEEGKSWGGTSKGKDRRTNHRHLLISLRNLPASTTDARVALVLAGHPPASVAELLWTLGSKEEKTVVCVEFLDFLLIAANKES